MKVKPRLVPEKERKHNYWSTCPECQGQGKRRRKLRKKARLQYEKELLLYTASNSIGKAPVRPLGHLYTCPHCAGSGLISSNAHPIPDTENFRSEEHTSELQSRPHLV